MKYKELLNNKVSENEEIISKKWDEINVLKESIKNREGKECFVFYDGPATANGMPGIHHAMAKVLKDTITKYKTMKGFKVLRKVGWDTHGLPVEVAVEKELGFSGKGDIEKYGIEKFNDRCKETVMQNEKAFTKFTKKLGQFIDTENPYITYHNSYMESEWHILKKMHEAGLIYEGLKIMPYCPRCGTGLASHEVSQGYKEVSVNSVYVTFKVKDKDEYFLVWTTTPWTLYANTGLCLNPNEEYVKVLTRGNKLILAAALVDNVLDDYEVLERYKGKELEGTIYEQLIPGIDFENKKSHIVMVDNYVTMSDGTGVVHIAPAFGEDDYRVAKEYDLALINPVDEEGKYKDGLWKGRFVLDEELELEIIKYLSDQEVLFKKKKIKHDYPHCWRCKTPLLYYSKPSLYINVQKFKEQVIKENNKVNWVPDYVGEKRFGNWLSNMNDWAISRNRYWGTAIPLWKCSCGHEIMVGSIDELVNLAEQDIDKNIDLHRPYVDNITIKCDHCGNSMKRISDVIDCWFDSGAMPFTQYHYPFENKELFEEQFPADFICEGIDQTRGWFYSLLVISVFLTGKSPYKSVLVNDLLLDKNGQKMHKSRGNAIDPFALIDKYGADAIRWYMLGTSPVWTPLKFDENGVIEVSSKFFNTLKNVYNFFILYANIDNLDIDYDFKDLELIDRWLLSRYNNVVSALTEDYEKYDLTKAVKEITNFVVEDLSNWYIRRNRERFWQKENNLSKKNVYSITHYVLVGITKIMAPLAPFLADEIYTNLTGEKSVHLEDFPETNYNLIDHELELDMDTLRDVISMGRSVRENASIKVRIPLSEIVLSNKQKYLMKYTDLIKEELNVKKVTFTEDIFKYMDMEILPNFKNAGKIFGKDLPLFKNVLQNFGNDKAVDLLNGETININISGSNYEINNELVEVRVKSKEGFDSLENGDLFVVLNTNLDDDLINEGLAREMISKIQNLRKSNKFDVEDRINIYFEADDEFKNRIKSYEEFIKKETLARDMINKNLEVETVNLNSYDVKIVLEKL